MQTKFYQFQKACSKHNRDGKEKGIFRCQFSAHAEENTPDDGCTGTGSTRNQGKQLEDSDKQCIFERNITELCSAGLPAFIVVFDNNKQYTVYDQHHGNDPVIHECFLDPFIKRKCHDDCRHTRYQNL